MVEKWLIWVNYVIVVVTVFLLGYAGVTQWQRPEIISLKEVSHRKTTPPKCSFSQSKDAYNQIAEPILSLKYRPPRMQLPDLKQKIIYYGQNSRPDAHVDSSLLHFEIAGANTASAAPKNKLYLVYDKNDGAGSYRFSPNNQVTSLWIEATAQNKEASLVLSMIDENGDIVTTPDTHAHFVLKEKEMTRYGNKSWEIGKWRVDPTLLARQKARWYGVDRFLERHGGDDFEFIRGKNRIDFDNQEEKYSVYVSEGSTLVWNGDEWKSVEPGEDSRGFPLLFVKKIDERLMNLELWDPEGKKKIALNLLKSMEPWMPQNLQQEFKFLGARTRSQYVFEVDDEKMLLSPNDWLLLTKEGWVKLNTVEEIDHYVQMQEVGTLFVFDGMTRVGDQQVIRGTLFNPTRSKMHDIELPVQKDGLVLQSTDKRNKLYKQVEVEKRPSAEYVNGYLDSKREVKDFK